MLLRVGVLWIGSSFGKVLLLCTASIAASSILKCPCINFDSLQHCMCQASMLFSTG